MKNNVFCVFMLALAVFVSLFSDEVPSRSIRGRKQSDLRKAYRDAMATCKAFSAETDTKPEFWGKRQQRIKVLLSQMTLPSVDTRPTLAGVSLMWKNRFRMKPLAAVTAREYTVGPNGAVMPFSGEFTDIANDLAGFERGGTRFELIRSYSSFSRYDCGFGIGWNFNYNSGLIVEGESIQKANRLTMFVGIRDISFTRQGDQWLPKQGQGIFLRLESRKDRILIYSPNLQRYEFELAAEQIPGKQCWRLAAIASRHDQYRANRLEISYLPKSDRIQHISDSFGEKFSFAYDKQGHIIQIAGTREYVEYSYDGDLLAQVTYAPVKLRLYGESFQPQIQYFYTKETNPLLREKSSNALKYTLQVQYDSQQRVSQAGFMAKTQKQMWNFQYLPGNVTVVRSPEPSPEVRYSFNEKHHPSLPSQLEIPAQNAVWKYEFNSDLRLVSVIDHLGIKKVNTYDSKNKNILARGNVLEEKWISGNAKDQSTNLRSYGNRTKYHDKIALPEEIQYYQVDKNGKETILKEEYFKYSPNDLMPICHTVGKISQYTAYNRFGLPALEWDANKNVTIYYYAESMPPKYSFDFVLGDAAAGGSLVRSIQDATDKQIESVCQAIGHKPIYRNTITRIAPCAQETRIAYDPYGNKIRSQSGYDESFGIFSSNGKILLSCDAASGLTEYQYTKSGRTDRIYHEFCRDENAQYHGFLFSHFPDSYYYTERFQYDEMDLLTEHQITDEKFQGVTPIYHYSRYPNGKVKKITSPSGVSRIDEYDLATGYLKAQTLTDGRQTQILTSGYQYYPGGKIKSYVEQFGGTYSYELDGFGRAVTVTNPQGVKTQKALDGLDRETTRITSFAGKTLSREEFFYSKEQQKIEVEKIWQISGNKSTILEKSRYLYDNAGNLIGKRGVRKDSWQYFLVDGCGNTVATVDPEGDIFIKLLRFGKPVYTTSIMKSKNKSFSTGMLISYDFAGRPIKNTPVDSNKKPAETRSIRFVYNTVGQKIETDSQGLTTSTAVYNTLGKAVREEVKPSSTTFGEAPNITEYEYQADGQMVSKTFQNKALALFGDKNNVKPELVEAPQKTIWEYDGLGRLVKTVNPDGLTTTKQYNQYSLPSDIRWTHVNEPDKILRHLSIKYTVLGKVYQLMDGISRKALREYTYDKLGNCVKSVDFSNNLPVTLERGFDSLGNVTMERLGYNGLKLPWSTFEYDLVQGKMDSGWKDFSSTSNNYWTRETRHSDRASRITGLSLDGEKDLFASWNYFGNMCEQRIIPESRITTQSSFTSMLEPKETVLSESGQVIGNLTYDYGKQGQPIYSGTKMGEEYSFAVYSQFDAFRRVVGQNGEVAIPLDQKETKERYTKIFGDEKTSVAAVNTSRLIYDQANNIWGRYSGCQLKQVDPLKLLNIQLAPRFASSAKVLPESSIPSPSLLLELASNREVTTASYANDCNLKATEQQYDHLGNLVEYEGTFWNGTRRYPVKWDLKFDTLGRLNEMKAKALTDQGFRRKDDLVAELSFVYDSENRRLQKQVTDYTRLGGAVTSTEITLYRGNQQSLVYTLKGNNELDLKGEYLWGTSERELLMASLPEHQAEKQGEVKVSRYFFQQDKGLNVIFTSKVVNGRMIPVAAESYLGFGDNSTYAKIKNINSSIAGSNEDRAYNRRLDESLDASWGNPGNFQFMEVELAEENKLAQLTIWTNKFPKNFSVFVLPDGVKTPVKENLTEWVNNQEHWEKYHAATIRQSIFDSQFMGDSLTSPYRLPLRELKGNRILLVFSEPSQSEIRVREFEVIKVADNPSEIAFAGQWFDRETGMYYQINRYRLAGSDKFISPDPIGFLDGNNLYAYAKGNPLEWHDPDGRWVQILAGAGIGAVLGGGMYTLNCWLNGNEFSWAEFGIYALAGAASGALVAGLGPLVGPVLAGAIAGSVGGAIAEGGITYLHTGDIYASLLAAGKGAAWGAAAGAFAGSLGLFGSSSSSFIGGFFRSVSIGSSTGGLFGGLRQGVDSYIATGDIRTAWQATRDGAVTGAFFGGMAAAAGYSMARCVSLWTNVGNKPYVSKIDRTAFAKAKIPFWQNRGKHPIKNNAYINTSENIARMKDGRAPIGRDGYPVEVHHPTGEVIPVEQMDIMTRTQHRLGENYKLNHPWMFRHNAHDYFFAPTTSLMFDW